jgi:hypothetical protein
MVKFLRISAVAAVTALLVMPSSLIRAEEPKAVERVVAVIVAKDANVFLQSKTKKLLKEATAPVEDIVVLRGVVGDPTKILIIGKTLGVTPLTLKDEDNKEEKLELIVVPAPQPQEWVRVPAVLVDKGKAVTLQSMTKKKIKTIVNKSEKLVRVQAAPKDPTKVLITGLAPGVAPLTLTDEDGKEEKLTVVVLKK